MTACKACKHCGLIHRLPELSAGESAACVRCGEVVHTPGWAGRSLRTTASAAIGALILYLPAMLLPILRIDRLGFHNESSILVGTVDIIRHGNWFVGGVVLLFSVVFPLIKLILLLELSLLRLMGRKSKAATHRVLEHVGRWSMMDVMLLAFLVMLVKLGALAEFQFGPGAVAFVLCVAMSIFASSSFDSRAIWETDV